MVKTDSLLNIFEPSPRRDKNDIVELVYCCVIQEYILI